ncbi:MAG: hypothetical protein O3A13_01865 [Proteobacteria bacterium]|nr:hypothetical protein [Pseudomonadota bacterium]MDA0992361.1 hypothetical protein [Pseudomonadota bacterium]
MTHNPRGEHQIRDVLTHLAILCVGVTQTTGIMAGHDACKSHRAAGGY